MSSNEITYSTQLFDKQFEEIKTELKGESISFKGLWVFAYIEGANSLQSIYFNHVDIKTLRENNATILCEIEKTCLDCDYGSLGDAFQKMNTDDNPAVTFLRDTYNDPKGTVCYYDLIISQKHACFVIIKEGDKTLGVLDFFFEGELDINQEQKIVEFFEKRFKLSEKQQCLTDYINALLIKEYESLVKLQNEKEGDKTKNREYKEELSDAVEYIEQIIASSSKTPLMIIKHKQGGCIPELVVLNYDYIHSIVEHENRFCSLTNKDKGCYYFNEIKIINDECRCDNDFLKVFYLDVLKKIKPVVVTYKIKVFGVDYDVEIVCSSGLDRRFKIDTPSFSKLTDSEFQNNVAINKYRDERVCLKLEEILKEKNHIYAFSLSRKIEPHLEYLAKSKRGESDCSQRNNHISLSDEIKKFISPSTILPVQYGQKDNALLNRNNSERKNIVHFKITNKKVFKQTLKQLIAIKPDVYLTALNPYLNMTQKEPPLNFKNLNISIAGESPLQENKFSGIIKGKFSLIEAILQENEVKLQATRAAISQVMARNMSHNIGSHVMSKLINGLNAIDWKKTKYKSVTENGKKISEKLQDGIEPDKKLIGQLNILNDYMRCRMDYLADIALGTPVMQHGKKIGSVLDELDRVRLLLEHISGLSDFEYSIDVNDFRITVAMPNNILGCQAFYNIIENIIRNTAKHSGVKAAQFIIEIDEALSEKVDTKNTTTDDLNEYYKVTIYDDVDLDGKITERVKKQNDKIKSLIIDSNYRLRHGSLGMAEMKASASYLRREDLAHIDSKITPPLLQACAKDGKYLGYEFYLRKPKEVLYILQKSSDIELKEELKSEGFDSLSIEEFSTLLGNGKIFHHKFVIFEKTVGAEVTQCYEKYNSSLPLRCISKDSIKINSSDSVKTLLESIWGDWSKLKGYDGYKINNGFPDNGEKILSFFNHQESVIIDKLENRPVESIIEQKVFVESIGNLAHKYLPYNENIPRVIPKQDASENTNGQNIETCNELNKDNIKLYLAFLCNEYRRVIENNDEFIAYRKLVLLQLIDAAMTRVVVVDERIQSFADDKQSKNNDKYRKLMNLVNVFIPTNETINLSSSELNKEKDCLDLYINEELNKDTMFLVLHYGILERIYEDEIEKRLKEWSDKCIIIVTSGRGAHFELPEKIRFINLSNIHNAFIEIRNKYYIVSLLHSTRK